MNDCKELLPTYLRFVKGVVDSEDLPLNVSRELLQQDRTLKTIRRNLVRKVFKSLEELRTEDGEKYGEFWRDFGRVLKEGLFVDPPQQEKLLGLSLYESTHDDGKPTT